MRNRKTQGFTLIELLIVIAIIGILAAVLIPNLLSARQRAFDTAAQTCLKEIATAEELVASTDPWAYSGGADAQTVTAAAPAATNGIQSCTGVVVTNLAGTATNVFGYSAAHVNGTTGRLYYIRNGSGVTTVAPTF